MPTVLEIPKKIPIKPPVIVKIGGRRTVANICSGLGSSGLELDRGLGSKVIKIKCDSQLVVNQVYGIFDTNEEHMQQYVKEVQALLTQFREWSIIHIPREENVEAYALANLGPHFIGSKVIKFLENLKIKRITSSPYHPSADRQAKSTNKVIIQNLKKKLEAAKGKWLEELPGVQWAYRTTTKSSTGETPFSLVYGVEALIPVEVGEPTLRFSQSNEEANNDAFLVRLDLLDEHRDLAYVRMVAQEQMMERYYNQRDNLRYFKIGDLVLRKVTQSTREVNTRKLGPIWESPYRISAVTGNGSYELENQNGFKLPSNWIVTHLKRYYY
ncbi:PREDICTED: uncharacterized protein LOC109211633 [Nicotiana attenuata]|uniref:uncharacterized protein LOC109211633 n=1 Tax=Nicotiana attenuata TaxID=49451 RepID=UPI0009049D5B|nr:PREDICTED: uncharacterized protein LOC109211633 [Nicotiana attenuata]